VGSKAKAKADVLRGEIQMLPYLSSIRPRAEAQPATVKQFWKSPTRYTRKINHGHLNAKKRRERAPTPVN